MARQLIEKPSEILEKITEDCLDLVGVKLKGEKIKLLIRLLIRLLNNFRVTLIHKFMSKFG